jgi:hypothetical protein
MSRPAMSGGGIVGCAWAFGSSCMPLGETEPLGRRDGAVRSRSFLEYREIGNLGNEVETDKSGLWP